VKLSELQPGTMYEVFWRQQSGNGRWYAKSAVWKFIEYVTNEYGDQLIWSGRPVCGTQDMDASSFIDAHPRLDTATPTVPRSRGELKKPS